MTFSFRRIKLKRHKKYAIDLQGEGLKRFLHNIDIFIWHDEKLYKGGYWQIGLPRINVVTT